MADLKAFLIENGFTADEVAAMPEKQQKAFAVALGKFDEGTTALTKSATEMVAAKAEREEAAKFWEEKVTPALSGMDDKIGAAKVQAARYASEIVALAANGYDMPKALVDEAKALIGAGSLPSSTPGRDPESGKYVTPDQMGKEFRAVAPTMVSLIALSNEYQDLFGGPYVTADTDWEEAQRARRPLREFVRDKYKFTDKRAARDQAKQDALNDTKVAAILKVKEAELVAKYGSNGDTRVPMPSKFDRVEQSRTGDKKDSWKTSSGRDSARKDRLAKFSNVTLQ